MMSKLIQKLLEWRKKRSGNTIGRGKLTIINSKTGICEVSGNTIGRGKLTIINSKAGICEVASAIAIGTRMITIKSAVTARLTAIAPVQ